MSAPRLVLIYRDTQLTELLAEHSTMGNIEFFLSTRGQTLQPILAADEAQRRVLDETAAMVPDDWRFVSVERSQLSRFLFEPDDFVVVVGQDGLVPNVSKYLTQQAVFGVSIATPGLLCRHTTAQLSLVMRGDAQLTRELRTTVEATLDDGQRLRALNEIFVGDPRHQSARYELRVDDMFEAQSSSGVIVGTGTGASGWLASLWHQSRPNFELPTPQSSNLAYFVREAWPSATTGTTLSSGLLIGSATFTLTARSSLVVFGDGIERDRLHLEWGQSLSIAASSAPLQLFLMQ